MLMGIGAAFLTKMFIKYFPFQPDEYQLKDVRKSAIFSIYVILVEMIINIIFLLSSKHISINTTNYISYALNFVLWQSFIYILTTAIVILSVRFEKESLLSIGITKTDLLKSIVLGTLLGVVCFIAKLLMTANTTISSFMTIASLISFIKFIFVGFGEEIVFRGYFQTRLIAWLGTTKGCLITAIVFSFWHLPVNMLVKGMDFQNAFFSCVELIPLSLALGYIFIKTKNITSVAILHTFIDWILN